MEDRKPSDRPTVIVAGGDEIIDPEVVAALPAASTVIAADSGLDRAVALGLDVDLVVGDMDSVDPATLAAARRNGTRVDVHPIDKDATDLELAIDAALDAGADRLVLLGGAGGRISHLLANALVIAGPQLEDVPVEWRLSGATVATARAGVDVDVHGAPGDLVSIIPIGGPAAGVRTTGLRWRLEGDTIETGSTRGISNELVAYTAAVRVDGGVALVIHERTP